MKYSNHRRTFCNRPHRISTLSPAISTVVSSGNDPTIENKHSPINKDYHDCIQYRSFTDFPYQNLCKNATTFAHRKWVPKGKVSVFHQCLAELPQCHMARDLYKHHSSHREKCATVWYMASGIDELYYEPRIEKYNRELGQKGSQSLSSSHSSSQLMI